MGDINLQAREFALLEYLMRNAGPRRHQNHDSGAHLDLCLSIPQTNVVDVLVCRLRNKVDRGFEQMIHTLRGVGYVLKRSVAGVRRAASDCA